jgi:hypothetical protein
MTEPTETPRMDAIKARHAERDAGPPPEYPFPTWQDSGHFYVPPEWRAAYLKVAPDSPTPDEWRMAQAGRLALIVPGEPKRDVSLDGKVALLPGGDLRDLDVFADKQARALWVHRTRMTAVDRQLRGERIAAQTGPRCELCGGPRIAGRAGDAQVLGGRDVLCLSCAIALSHRIAARLADSLDQAKLDALADKVIAGWT